MLPGPVTMLFWAVLVLIVFPAMFSFWRGRGLPALVPRPGHRNNTGDNGEEQS